MSVVVFELLGLHVSYVMGFSVAECEAFCLHVRYVMEFSVVVCEVLGLHVRYVMGFSLAVCEAFCLQVVGFSSWVASFLSCCIMSSASVHDMVNMILLAS